MCIAALLERVTTFLAEIWETHFWDKLPANAVK